jgi:hypothetical protein
VRRLAAKRLLPAERADIDLRPVDVLGESAGSRSAAIQSAFGTRTPLVVPFQVKTMSLSASMPERSGILPYSAVRISAASFSCLATSVTQPAPKLSQASIVTGRAPSSDHIAISIAPVSDAGTIASR